MDTPPPPIPPQIPPGSFVPNSGSPPPAAAQPLGYGYGMPMRPAASGASIASLVLGIVGCVPIITGALAIVFGIIGIRQSRNPAVGGRGMAIAGLVLGIVSVLGWASVGGMFGYAWHEFKPARVVATTFLQDESSGNLAAAQALTAGMTQAQLVALHQQLTPLGTLQSANFNSFNQSWVNGVSTMKISGPVYFATGVKTCDMVLIEQGTRSLVTSCKVY